MLIEYVLCTQNSITPSERSRYGNFGRKTAIVTGAASGIGRQITFTFAGEGCSVIGFDLNAEGLSAVEKEITGKGQSFIPYSGDLTNEKDDKGVVEPAMDKYGKLDILVNCAGIVSNMEPISYSTPKHLKKLLTLPMAKARRFLFHRCPVFHLSA